MKTSKRRVEKKNAKSSLQLKLDFNDQKDLKPKRNLGSKVKSLRNELLKEALKEYVKLAIKSLYENLPHLFHMFKLHLLEILNWLEGIV